MGIPAVFKASLTKASLSTRSFFPWLLSSNSTTQTVFIVSGSQRTKSTCFEQILLKADFHSLELYGASMMSASRTFGAMTYLYSEAVFNTWKKDNSALLSNFVF